MVFLSSSTKVFARLVFSISLICEDGEDIFEVFSLGTVYTENVKRICLILMAE